MNEKPTRTSYSALTTFETCPFSYLQYYMNGFRDEGGAAAARGTRLHLAAERYLKGEIPMERLPIDFWKIRPKLQIYKDLGAIAEETWLVDKDWNHQDVEDEHTRLKALTDIHWLTEDTIQIVDLKTGRNYPEHQDQLQLYAILGMLKYPTHHRVEVAALYVDDGVLGHQQTYHRGALPHLQDYWQKRMDILFGATEYPETPSVDGCRYCKLKKSKGGPCSQNL
jgi:RecB family exonuclease